MLVGCLAVSEQFHDPISQIASVKRPVTNQWARFIVHGYGPDDTETSRLKHIFLGAFRGTLNILNSSLSSTLLSVILDPGSLHCSPAPQVHRAVLPDLLCKFNKIVWSSRACRKEFWCDRALMVHSIWSLNFRAPNYNAPWSQISDLESQKHLPNDNLKSKRAAAQTNTCESCRIDCLLACPSHLCFTQSVLHTVLPNFYPWTRCFVFCTSKILCNALLATCTVNDSYQSLTWQELVFQTVVPEHCQPGYDIIPCPNYQLLRWMERTITEGFTETVLWYT